MRQESVGESRKLFNAFLTGIFAGVSRLRLQAKKQDYYISIKYPFSPHFLNKM